MSGGQSWLGNLEYVYLPVLATEMFRENFNIIGVSIANYIPHKDKSKKTRLFIDDLIKEIVK